MEEYLNNEALINYKGADIILNLLFAVIDAIIIIFSLFNLKSKNIKIYFLKYKYLALFVIDIILRLFYIKKDYKDKSLFKELFFSTLISIQFFFLVSFLEQSYNDSRLNKKGKSYKKLHSKVLSVVFLILTFPYHKFSSSQKETCFIQSLIIIYWFFLIYAKLKNKLIKTVQNLSKQMEVKNKNIIICVSGSPLPILILFISYYMLLIIFLSLTDQDHIVYANIILKVIKDSSKYFLFFILGLILYIICGNKIDKEILKEDSDYNREIKIKK